MMGFENQGFEEAQLYASREEMESLVLDDDDNNNSGNDNNNNPSSRSNGGANGDGSQHHHPLSPSSPFAEISTTEDDDPLQSSSSRHQNPNSFNSLLEPPSYAEAVFRSFDGDRGKQINGDSASSTSSPSSSSDYLKISVTDPQKEQDLNNSLVPGGNTFVTYLITTWTNLPEFNGTEFSVRRRFKDVVTLSDRLSDSYRGYFIPLRPDKSVVESQVMQKQEFVEQRRMALEKYLRKLAAHPVIRRSEELRLFLQVQGKLPLMKTTDVASRMLDGAVKLPKQLFGEPNVHLTGDLTGVNLKDEIRNKNDT